MEYTLKNKIEVSKEFLSDLIARYWQESENVNQQIANIDTSSYIGAEVAKLLKNASTNYYVLIGCLETLLENPTSEIYNVKESNLDSEPLQTQNTEQSVQLDSTVELPVDTNETSCVSIEPDDNFEPFEYFVDFDEPVGDPLSDEDLYGN